MSWQKTAMGYDDNKYDNRLNTLKLFEQCLCPYHLSPMHLYALVCMCPEQIRILRYAYHVLISYKKELYWGASD
jgi:hypothetical protein